MSHRQTPIHPSRPHLSGLYYLKTSADFPWGVFFLSLVYRVEKAMAPNSGTLAWKIPWAEEPGGLQSMGSHRVGHDGSDLAAAVAVYSVVMWSPTCPSHWSTSRVETEFYSHVFYQTCTTVSFILCVCSVAQSRLIPCNCMDCSPPGSSVHGIL